MNCHMPTALARLVAVLEKPLSISARYTRSPGSPCSASRCADHALVARHAREPDAHALAALALEEVEVVLDAVVAGVGVDVDVPADRRRRSAARLGVVVRRGGPRRAPRAPLRRPRCRPRGGARRRALPRGTSVSSAGAGGSSSFAGSGRVRERVGRGLRAARPLASGPPAGGRRWPPHARATARQDRRTNRCITYSGMSGETVPPTGQGARAGSGDIRVRKPREPRRTTASCPASEASNA